MAVQNVALSQWSITSAQDKSTDKQIYEARIQAPLIPNSPFVYELVLKCGEAPPLSAAGVTLSIATFEQSRTGALTPRPMAWTTPIVQIESVPPKPFRYRIDYGGFVESSLHARFVNVGTVESLTALPNTRLVVADLFPNETVEIPFNTLTSSQRATMQQACFPPPPESRGIVTDPRPFRRATPKYTSDAMRARLEGTVVVHCLVRTTGAVTDCQVNVDESALKSGLALDRNAKNAAEQRSLIQAGTRQLEGEAIRAALQWGFAPGTKDKVPVDTKVEIEVGFRLR